MVHEASFADGVSFETLGLVQEIHLAAISGRDLCPFFGRRAEDIEDE